MEKIYEEYILLYRGRHLKRYSVISITLRYISALSHTLTLLKSLITYIIYLSVHIGAVIASYSYCSKLIGQRYCFYLLSLFYYYYLFISSTLEISSKVVGA
jgi:hypothetical protein